MQTCCWYTRCKVNSDKWFERRLDQRTRAALDDLHLRQAFARLDSQREFFTMRVVKHWNRLPYKLRSAPTVYSFKNELKKHRAAPSEAMEPGMRN